MQIKIAGTVILYNLLKFLFNNAINTFDIITLRRKFSNEKYIIYYSRI